MLQGEQEDLTKQMLNNGANVGNAANGVATTEQATSSAAERRANDRALQAMKTAVLEAMPSCDGNYYNNMQLICSPEKYGVRDSSSFGKLLEAHKCGFTFMVRNQVPLSNNRIFVDADIVRLGSWHQAGPQTGPNMAQLRQRVTTYIDMDALEAYKSPQGNVLPRFKDNRQPDVENVTNLMQMQMPTKHSLPTTTASGSNASPAGGSPLSYGSYRAPPWRPRLEFDSPLQRHQLEQQWVREALDLHGADVYRQAVQQALSPNMLNQPRQGSAEYFRMAQDFALFGAPDFLNMPLNTAAAPNTAAAAAAAYDPAPAATGHAAPSATAAAPAAVYPTTVYSAAVSPAAVSPTAVSPTAAAPSSPAAAIPVAVSPAARRAANAERRRVRAAESYDVAFPPLPSK